MTQWYYFLSKSKYIYRISNNTIYSCKTCHLLSFSTVSVASETAKQSLITGRRILDQYNLLKKQYPGFLLFLRIGDFYETFLEDAKTAAQLLGIALARAHGYKTKGQELPMAGVPFWAFDSYLHRLVKAGIRVAVADQIFDSNDKNSRKVSGRAVTRLVTPGTLIEDDLLRPSENNYLACLLVENDANSEGKIGISWLDISTGDFQCALESTSSIQEAMNAIAPSELLIREDQYTAIQSIVPNLSQFCTISPISLQDTPLKNEQWTPFAFSLKDASSLFEMKKRKLLSDLNVVAMSELEQQSCAILLMYVETTLSGQLPFLSSLAQSPVSTFMRMDVATRKALEISRRMNMHEDGQKGSLLAAIRKTLTSPGSRLLAMRLNSPLLCQKSIEERLNAVEYLCQHKELTKTLREKLVKCPEYERPLQRLFLQRGSPRDLHDLGVTCLQASSMKDLFYENMKDSPSYLRQQVNKLRGLDSIANLLLSCISENAPRNLSTHAATGKKTQLFGEGCIMVGYDAELDRLRQMRDDLLNRIQELEQKYQQQTGMDSLKIRYNYNLGFIIEVIRSRNNVNMDEKAFYPIRLPTKSTNATVLRYRTQELSIVERELNGIVEQIQNTEDAVFRDINHQVNQHAYEIREMAGALAEIDVTCALATLAMERHFCRPSFVEGQIFVVNDGRHATLEHRQFDRKQVEPPSVLIPNDCFLNGQHGKLWLITGPNMAGKSTFLRQNAIIAILAQIGSFVPASSAQLSMIDRIFCRVGASDDIYDGQSTFMMEMNETANILKNATGHSLVIMDEVGRGTSMLEGLAIAQAIVEYLHDQIGCRTLFATHFHELTKLEHHLKMLSCCYSEAILLENNQELCFTYKIRKGAVQHSYASKIAALAGLPSSLIQRTEQIVQHLLESKNLSSKTFWYQWIEQLEQLDFDAISPHQAIGLLKKWRKESQEWKKGIMKYERKEDTANEELDR
eukprot:jgi/Galph1/3804/GphlegSOOS_G2470.1